MGTCDEVNSGVALTHSSVISTALGTGWLQKLVQAALCVCVQLD